MSKKVTLIEIENLEYNSIFKDLNIKIYAGTFNVLAGASLSGKTTLLKIIGGLIKTNSVIKYKGKGYNEINKKTILENIKYIDIDSKVVFKENKVEDIFLTNLKNKIKEEEITKKYKETIKECMITESLNKNFNELNKLEKAKVMLGLSLITEPKLILIDNICSLTSKKERKEFENILDKLKNDYNISVLIATSNLLPAENADYIYVINKGEIVLEGEKEKVLREDNKLNKYSLELPFIYDLSDKLIDYNLIENVIGDIDRMVNALWK